MDTWRALLAGLDGLCVASVTGTPGTMVPALLDEAKRSVWALATETHGHSDRMQRVPFAVIRLADALGMAQRPDGPVPTKDHSAARPSTDRAHGGEVPVDGS